MQQSRTAHNSICLSCTIQLPPGREATSVKSAIKDWMLLGVAPMG